MRIVCPNCQAAYELPPSLVGSANREVRCARCQTEWLPPEFAELPAPTVERAVAAFADPGEMGSIPGRLAPGLSASGIPSPGVSSPAASSPGAPSSTPFPPDYPPALPGAEASPDMAPRGARELDPPERPSGGARLEGDTKSLHRRQRPGIRIEVLAAIGFSLLLVAAMAVEAYVWREAVMQAWPASARVFALLPSMDIANRH